MADEHRHLIHTLERHPDVLFAFLFGSRAGGRPRADSDWDVAVYVSEHLSRHQQFDLRRQLTVELAELGMVQVTVLNTAPALLGHRALMGRRLLMRDHTAYVRYFVRTLAQSEDERYYRDLHREARRERLNTRRYGRP